MDCQGNMILRGLPADINVMPQSLSKLTEGLCAGLCDCMFGCSRGKTTIAHTSGAAQWTLGSRCDKTEDCRHLRGSCSHKKPRSSLSAQMCHSGGLTAQRETLHGWVHYTYWKSIAIFQWQLQDIFEQQPLLNRVWSDFMQVFHWRKIKGAKGSMGCLTLVYRYSIGSLCFLIFVTHLWLELVFCFKCNAMLSVALYLIVLPCYQCWESTF